MTIELHNVTKKVRLGHIKVVYSGLNVTIPGGVNMALLGRKQAGMERIVDLICGADAPDKGSVSRSESISWSIPSTGFIAKHLTMAANARFVARLYEVAEDPYLARIVELGQLGEWVNARVDECPNEVRSMLCFLAGICLPFDRYIVNSLSIGGKAGRARTTEIVEDLCKRSNILLVGQDIKGAQQFCQQAYIFDEGQATFYDDMEAAAEHFNSIESQDVGGDDFMGGDSELEDLVNMDF